MTAKEIFYKVIELQELIFSGDDLMDQEVLFDVQDKIATLSLEVAKASGWVIQDKKQYLATDVLIEKFPHLYKRA